VHLITGFILAGLLGKKKNQKHSPLLKISGPIQTSHVLPGRVRFHVSSLKNDDNKTNLIKEQLPKIEGVDSVQVNKTSGSVLFRFNKEKIKPELLCAALIRLLELEKELEKTPKPILTKELSEMGTALNRAVFEKTGGIIDLWTAVPILLIIFGFRRILTDRATMWPTGFTMLWWAYNSLFRTQGE
jgi:hypothetical protein